MVPSSTLKASHGEETSRPVPGSYLRALCLKCMVSSAVGWSGGITFDLWSGGGGVGAQPKALAAAYVLEVFWITQISDSRASHAWC